MTTIQVMRKALEALEHPQAGLVPHQGEWRSRTSLAIDALRAELERLEAVEPACNPHPKAPHGFNRNASHSAGRSVCDCESWDPYEEGYQAGLLAGLAHDSAPIAPAIPALTIDEVAEGAPGFSNVPKYGPAYLAGAHWAYTLAAARTGARIIKADTLQELADDAKQIGLEY